MVVSGPLLEVYKTVLEPKFRGKTSRCFWATVRTFPVPTVPPWCPTVVGVCQGFPEPNPQPFQEKQPETFSLVFGRLDGRTARPEGRGFGTWVVVKCYYRLKSKLWYPTSFFSTHLKKFKVLFS